MDKDLQFESNLGYRARSSTTYPIVFFAARVLEHEWCRPNTPVLDWREFFDNHLGQFVQRLCKDIRYSRPVTQSSIDLFQGPPTSSSQTSNVPPTTQLGDVSFLGRQHHHLPGRPYPARRGWERVLALLEEGPTSLPSFEL